MPEDLKGTAAYRVCYPVQLGDSDLTCLLVPIGDPDRVDASVQ